MTFIILFILAVFILHIIGFRRELSIVAMNHFYNVRGWFRSRQYK